MDLVRRVADELGYVPRKYTRKEAEQAGGTVSLLISGFHDLQNNTFYSQIVAGVESVLAGANYRLLFKTISGTLSEDREVIDELVPTQDGIVLVGYEVDVEVIARIKEFRKPFVLVDNDCWALNIDTVTNDNLSGARRLVTHLIELGHSRIGFVGGPYTHVSLDERYNGYKQALKNAGLEKPADCIAFAAPQFDTEHGYAVALKMLRRASELPTAVFAANDALAIGVIKAARELGCACRKICRWPGSTISRCPATSPGLTTVRVHQYEMGMEAGKRLLDLIRGEVTKPLKIVLSTELVIPQVDGRSCRKDAAAHCLNRQRGERA